MSKRCMVHRTQKIVIFIMSALACILFLLIWKTPKVEIISLTHSVFTTPKTHSANDTTPQLFILKLDSNNLILLNKLQEQGWPAYLIQNKIQIGPYLKSFQPLLDLTKISQMTSIPVRIADIHFL